MNLIVCNLIKQIWCRLEKYMLNMCIDVNFAEKKKKLFKIMNILEIVTLYIIT